MQTVIQPNKDNSSKYCKYMWQEEYCAKSHTDMRQECDGQTVMCRKI